jgi:pyruvate-formate lyase
MHHSDIQYWQYLQGLPAGDRNLPSPRVCRLLHRIFQRWKDRKAWLAADQVGHLFRDREDLSPQDRGGLARKPLAVRKALAIQRMLEIVADRKLSGPAGSTAIADDELIVGTMPPFSVGQGKEFVRYLTQDEELAGELVYLNELSPMGHIVPNHGIVLERGLEAMAHDAEQKAKVAAANQMQSAFYESVAISLRAVIEFAANHARMAREKAALPSTPPERKADLELVASNLEAAPRTPAKTFHQALQAIYLLHCALHWTVEIVPIGRLDQLLYPYFKRDIEAKTLNQEDAQELIDCFWIKLDERVILTPRFAENRFTSSDGQLTGSTGPANYDQGALLNQWMQQITIGGVLPADGDQAQDASNAVTRLCLNAARRLPLNSPTLDLRLQPGTPNDIVELAAEALLSGGAHPVLLNDNIIVPALMKNAGHPIPARAARNYACDGCYETMVAGESEFSFGFVSALDVIEKTLNRGAGIAAAGATNLRGLKGSWRSKPASEIRDFEEFQEILRSHMLLAVHRYFQGLYGLYGSKADIAPSPLLSALIKGCLETGRDLAAGGANYHIFSPLLVGVSSAADSLYVIHNLVFEQKAFTLTELLSSLVTDWGHAFIPIGGEPSVSFGLSVDEGRVKEIRALCLNQPKFGAGDPRVDRYGWWLLETFADCVQRASTDPIHKDARNRLEKQYSIPNVPFRMHFAPGVGTFEQYAFSGSFNGASADGRRSMAPIASDLSPAPVCSDAPATVQTNSEIRHARMFDLNDSLRSYAAPVMAQLGDGAPVDYNIREDFSLGDLSEFIRKFADGEGGSICTFTVCNPETFAAAQQDPDQYNLIRVRMGGWTEFFVALFPHHQEQHMRRPLYV